MPDTWLKAKVIRGLRQGQKINIPTVNLKNPSLMENFALGVYAAKIKIGKKEYLGSLYYGPKTLNKQNYNSLEIHIFNFKGNLYNRKILFIPQKFIRKPITFTSLNQMQKIIEDDNKNINLLK
jgi:riboflavin kinase/FMN adenylyltransferase